MSWRIFDRIAGDYDKWYEDNMEIYLSELTCLRSFQARLPSIGRCLEVGAGTGRFIIDRELEIALDPSWEMLRIARERGRVVDAINAVGERMPVRDSSLDCVKIVLSLCFTDSPKEVLSEAIRAIRPRGFLITCIIPSESVLASKYLERARREPTSIYRFFRPLSREELLGLLNAIGAIPQAECHTLIENGSPNFLCVESLVPKVRG